MAVKKKSVHGITVWSFWCALIRWHTKSSVNVGNYHSYYSMTSFRFRHIYGVKINVRMYMCMYSYTVDSYLPQWRTHRVEWWLRLIQYRTQCWTLAWVCTTLCCHSPQHAQSWKRSQDQPRLLYISCIILYPSRNALGLVINILCRYTDVHTIIISAMQYIVCRMYSVPLCQSTSY